VRQAWLSGETASNNRDPLECSHVRVHILSTVLTLTVVGCAGDVEPTRTTWCDNLPRPGNAGLDRVPTPSEWYEVYRVDPGVFAIAEPRQFEEVISFLVLGSDRALLFDTGLNIEPIAPLVGELTDLPVTVLNSHTHPDHVGGNAAFDVILGSASEYATRNAGGFGTEELRGILAPGAVCGSLPRGLDPTAYAIGPWTVTATVNEGDVIDLGERRLEALLTPGHSPDALMLLDRDAGLLFTGDSFYEGPIYVMDTYSDFEEYTESMERIAGLAAELQKLLTAHNVAVSDPDLLNELAAAVRTIRDGSATPEASESDVTTFAFGSFAIMVPDSVAEPR
jgi:glyoxylase-like metal-dependent hydrolase (beta-lactamase superfamily II)